MRKSAATIALLLVLTCPAVSFQPAPVFDIVIRNGRVLDPETKSDKIANVGIIRGTIEAISEDSLDGKKIIDASGLVVAPGFIDLLSYDPNAVGVWNKIADGVTTNLAMHGGTAWPDQWYAHYERQKVPLNFGASFFYTEARNQLIANRYRSADSSQIRKLLVIAERALKQGALGISFSLEYIPGVNSAEIVPMMHLAKRYNVPVFFHARFSDTLEPGTNFDALNELIGYARQTGASIHIDHITSTGGTFSMAKSLELLEAAKGGGLDITACLYPYNFWGTYLNSARFDAGWQKRFGVSYKDLQLGGTTERLNDSTFRRYQKEGKLAIAYAIPDADVEAAFRSPFVMMGSDAIMSRSLNHHPRASGTFARTLGMYVREKKVLTLMDAIAKMTFLPAQRMEQASSAFKKKGRLSIGADADIVVFDDRKISDRATVERPDIMSVGVEYVMINGHIVKDPKGLRKNVRAGQPIRNEHRASK